ncbi:MAG: hypothetical protein L0Y74_03550 [candidate division Zixibacteria bacterium]|nr:hypothetical protein [candidate division Zixibacteria bacterium]
MALHGLPVTAEHIFDNQRGVGNLEQRQAEKVALENIIRKQKEGYISFEDAKRRAENV